MPNVDTETLDIYNYLQKLLDPDLNEFKIIYPKDLSNLSKKYKNKVYILSGYVIINTWTRTS